MSGEKQLLYSGPLTPLGDNGQYKLILPWALTFKGDGPVSIELRDAEFFGPIRSVLPRETIFTGSEYALFTNLPLNDPEDMVRKINAAPELSAAGISFELNPTSDHVTIHNTRSVGMYLSAGLACVFGVTKGPVKHETIGIVEPMRILSSLVLTCSQVRANTMIASGLYPGIGETRLTVVDEDDYEVEGRQIVKIDHHTSFGPCELLSKQITSLNLQFVSATVPETPVELGAMGTVTLVVRQK